MVTAQIVIEPSRHAAIQGPTSFKTERNQHEVHCGMCGMFTYVDEGIFRFCSDAIKAGLDNPFRCEMCQEEYDDLAYEG